MSDQKYHQALTANRKLLEENTRLKAEVERLRASSFVTAVPVEEYEKLKAEVERLEMLKDACKRMIRRRDKWIFERRVKSERLKAEVERLQQEKNELAVMIHPVSLKAWIRTKEWNAAKEGKPSV